MARIHTSEEEDYAETTRLNAKFQLSRRQQRRMAKLRTKTKFALQAEYFADLQVIEQLLKQLEENSFAPESESGLTEENSFAPESESGLTEENSFAPESESGLTSAISNKPGSSERPSRA
eukprot:404274-Amphidinium_carterae.1